MPRSALYLPRHVANIFLPTASCRIVQIILGFALSSHISEYIPSHGIDHQTVQVISEHTFAAFTRVYAARGELSAHRGHIFNYQSERQTIQSDIYATQLANCS